MQLTEIELRTKKVDVCPQSNGYVERLYRTLLDGHFRVMVRTKFYESGNEMQAGQGAHSHFRCRPAQGRKRKGGNETESRLN